MSKHNLTNLERDEQLKLIQTYIRQRSFHKNQNVKITADDLIRIFKHKKFSNGVRRVKFFNQLLVETVSKYSDTNEEFQKVKIIIQRL